MPSVMVSGESSEGTSSEAFGGEDNPIELGDSSTTGGSDTESESEEHEEQDAVKKESNAGGEDEGVDDNGDEEGNNKYADADNSEGHGDDKMDIDGGKDQKSLDQQNKSGNVDSNSKNDDDNKDLRKGKNLWENIESMSEITKSPYEGNECAEVGEDCFEELRLLMHPSETDGTINPRMVELVGDKLARDLCNAHHEIGKSGMLYSANWKEGKIRDSDFGWIPRRQLLLCLHEHRFAKGNVTVLQNMTRNLDCTKLVLEAMRLWDLMDSYPNLASNKNEETFSFGNNKVFCYKCQIFVARAFATLQILNKTEGLEQSLTKKIKACLGILDGNVRVNQIELARINKNAQKRKAFEIHMEEQEAVTSKSSRSKKSENSVSQTKEAATSKAAAPPKVPKPRAPKRRVPSTSASVPQKEPRKRRKKIPKREEREESIFMLFNTMHVQVQRLNQMMSFFQSQLQDHRGILREEVKENLGNGNTEG